MSNETSARIEGETVTLCQYCRFTKANHIDGKYCSINRVCEFKAARPKLGESGLSDEQFVKHVHPQAQDWRGWGDDGPIAIWNGLRGESEQLSGHFKTAEEAWADARALIEAKPPYGADVSIEKPRARIEAKPEPLPNTPQEEPVRCVLRRAVKALEELYPTERGGYQHSEEYRAVHAVLNDARTVLAAPKVVDSKEEQGYPNLCRERPELNHLYPEGGVTLDIAREKVVSLINNAYNLGAAPKVVDSKEEQDFDPLVCAHGVFLRSVCSECGDEADEATLPEKVEEQDGEQELPPIDVTEKDHARLKADNPKTNSVGRRCALLYYCRERQFSRALIENATLKLRQSLMEGMGANGPALLEQLRAENKLLKAESVAPPSLPTQEEFLAWWKEYSPIRTIGEHAYNYLQCAYAAWNASRAAAPVALPMHQLVSNNWGGVSAELRCSCGRIFVGLGDEALASSRASFGAHLPEKEGK